MKYIIFLAILISLFSLSVSLYIAREFSVYKNVSNSSVNVSTSATNAIDRKNETAVTIDSDTCGVLCQSFIDQKISEYISTLSASRATTPSKQTTEVKSTPKTSYVNFDGTYTTTSTDWTTIDASAVVIDLENDYGKSASVYFTASLKIGNGSGQAYVRLYDDTNKIAVSGSELTSLNNINYSLIETQNLPFWKGRNTYKLQIKSLNSQEVFVTNSKLKIYY